MALFEVQDLGFLILIYSYNYMFKSYSQFVYHQTLFALIPPEGRLDFDNNWTSHYSI